ncbi:segregation/condensation protein A [candidate division KSB1 bacterium]|nr:segregation/condensation protein A [candidate division KSB1 bacterium]
MIKKNEVDIYDIPISSITEQYLGYLEIIQLLDLEAASDFILMAATLMRIKAQMLLPRPVLEDETDEIDDPRTELVIRILEYKRFKDVAVNLGEKEEQAKELYPRGKFTFEDNDLEEELAQSSDVSLFDLVAAFKKLVEQRKKVTIHRIQDIHVTLDERVEFIKKRLTGKDKVSFKSLFNKNDDKMVWIVTFIAVLELIKQRFIRAVQPEAYGEISIIKING